MNSFCQKKTRIYLAIQVVIQVVQKVSDYFRKSSSEKNMTKIKNAGFHSCNATQELNWSEKPFFEETSHTEKLSLTEVMSVWSSFLKWLCFSNNFTKINGIKSSHSMLEFSVLSISGLKGVYKKIDLTFTITISSQGDFPNFCLFVRMTQSIKFFV